MDFYSTIVRPILFSGLKADPEWLHHQTLEMLHWLDAKAPMSLRLWLMQRMAAMYGLSEPRLNQTLWNCPFTNPIGLAAGFDKDGMAAGIWPAFGFGFAEVGTVTAQAQPGNPKPRLFRLMDDWAALNRMGFNNQGASTLAQRLSQHRARPEQFPIGINLGKSKITPLEEAAQDYLASFQQLKTLGDYFVVNVSSPNTPGLRSLQSIDQLEPIFAALQQENGNRKPLLVKIAPDLADEDIRSVVELAQQYQLAGMIATNTTIRRDGLKTQILAATGKSLQEEAGGISGAPVKARSTEVIRLIYQQTQGRLPIIGVGGIFTAEDAWEKITAGASLLQVYTGWIYEGPGMVKRILQGLVQKMDEAGLGSIADAVGLDHRAP
ncbi:MAG: dihydroorotate dehydrogenase (quinone) [Alkalinema sp. CACIAM 70d]|nr:MAG: dihydroorotate dehydrogenase (quinone) [Alkalinema sp. CACIAM 70d]